MKELLITSSVLIAALMLLRGLFRGRLSPRIQYALWLLAALRLLVPVNLPTMGFSVLSAAQPLEEMVALHLEQTGPAAHEGAGPAVSQAGAPQAMAEAPEHHPASAGTAPAEAGTTEPPAAPSRAVSLSSLLHGIWYAGIAAVGLFFLFSNLHLWRKLRHQRRAYETDSPFSVYRVEEGVLPSSCLFGLFRPGIYLTPEAFSSETTLRHVLLHEETHARHLDHIWSLLRCVCLALYWFHPLVWVAAFASRTDCELACDESVVARLGKKERIAYGQTLLTLVSSQGRRENPFLAATTMTAGKKALKARITHIARPPKRFAAGTAAVLLLTAALAACTFTGGEEAHGVRPLTAQELSSFNGQYFNSADGNGENGAYVNLHNQFANPMNLYERPEEIDLYALFYLESSEVPGEEEMRSILQMDPEYASVPVYKLSGARMDELLLENLGLTREETEQKGLASFTYSQETDAYYWMHGDTNYCGDLEFLCGTRETGPQGERIRLYHRASPYSGADWYCVTLAPQEDGGFHFVSNQACGHPAIPMPLPRTDAEEQLSRADPEPYTPPVLQWERRPASDFDGDYRSCLDNWEIDGTHVLIYRAVDGVTRAAAVQEDGSHLIFLTDLTPESSAFFFYDLFGHDGFMVSHVTQDGEDAPGRVYDFFTAGEAGKPDLLLRIHAPSAPPRMLDLDGDGKDELVSETELFFQRDGVLCRAELTASNATR